MSDKINGDIPKDPITTAKEIGELMLDTLKEHGRDEQSKNEIVDFFMAVFCGREKLNCEYQFGEIIEYHSFKRKKWMKAKVLDLKGQAQWNKNSPQEMVIQILDNNSQRTIDKRSWEHRVRKLKQK
jgi:hypothetical protein